MTSESLLSIGVGLALAAAAGFRVFVPLLALSLAAQAGWVALSPSFAWLATTPATVALATATILEIAAYYVPFFDNLLDTLAAPLAVVAGIVASASLLTDLPPWLQYSIAIIGAGGTAGVVHASTSLLRLKSSSGNGRLRQSDPGDPGARRIGAHRGARAPGAARRPGRCGADDRVDRQAR